jgi:hypothetical protein
MQSFGWAVRFPGKNLSRADLSNACRTKYRPSLVDSFTHQELDSVHLSITVPCPIKYTYYLMGLAPPKLCTSTVLGTQPNSPEKTSTASPDIASINRLASDLNEASVLNESDRRSGPIESQCVDVIGKWLCVLTGGHTASALHCTTVSRVQMWLVRARAQPAATMSCLYLFAQSSQYQFVPRILPITTTKASATKPQHTLHIANNEPHLMDFGTLAPTPS